nr:hypothetical protein [uncultured Methanoregula sp.]
MAAEEASTEQVFAALQAGSIGVVSVENVDHVVTCTAGADEIAVRAILDGYPGWTGATVIIPVIVPDRDPEPMEMP